MRGPSPKQWKCIDEARLHISAAVSALCGISTGQTVDADADAAAVAAIREITRDNAGVRGNRPASENTTWDDARLCLAATLRRLLSELEATP